VNPEPAEPDSLTHDEALLETFCASAQYAPDLADDEVVVRAADDLIDRISYEATVTEFHAVFVRAVTSGTLPPAALAAAGSHSAAAILSFLGRLLAELERRRPWPDPALVQLDPGHWPPLDSSLPIAWVDLPLPLVEQATRASFGAPFEGASPGTEMPLMVLRLRTGHMVALLGDGEQGPEPSSFLVLLTDTRRRRESAAVIEYLVRYTGLPLETAGIKRAMTAADKL